MGYKRNSSPSPALADSEQVAQYPFYEPILQGPPADEDLHDLIAERYETATTVVTSNLDFTEWDQAFPANRLLALATLDRLRHNAYCLVLDGQSYRAPKLAPANTRSRVANSSKTTHS